MRPPSAATGRDANGGAGVREDDAEVRRGTAVGTTRLPAGAGSVTGTCAGAPSAHRSYHATITGPRGVVNSSAVTQSGVGTARTSVMPGVILANRPTAQSRGVYPRRRRF